MHGYAINIQFTYLLRQIMLTPNSNKRRYLHTVREHPREYDHKCDVVFAVHARVPAMVGYHYIPEIKTF